jgi:hypothetical protein
MRPFFISAALAALLIACSPPAQRDADAPPPANPPAVQACNDVTPNLSRLVQVEEALAVAAAASDLRGGRVTPGVYDLASASRIGAAPGWQGGRAVALNVTEDAGGAVTFNWAGGAGAEVDRWTATFADTTPGAQLTYTCGRMGTVSAEFAATANALQLRLPDGANGSLQLDFERRS